MGGMFTVRHHHVDRDDGEADNWWEIRWHPDDGTRRVAVLAAGQVIQVVDRLEDVSPAMVAWLNKENHE